MPGREGPGPEGKLHDTDSCTELATVDKGFFFLVFVGVVHGGYNFRIVQRSPEGSTSIYQPEHWTP